MHRSAAFASRLPRPVAGLMIAAACLLSAPTAWAGDPPAAGAAAKAAPAAAGGAAATPEARIEDRHKQIRHWLNEAPDLDDEARREKVKDVLLTFVDFDRVARTAFKKHFDKLTEAERADYVAAFRALVQATYLRRIKPGKAFSMTFRGPAERRGGKARVPSVFRTGRSEAYVDYLLYEGEGGEWRAYDIVIDEVSMARNYRSEFYKVYRDKGLAGLVERIRERTREKSAKGS